MSSYTGPDDRSPEGVAKARSRMMEAGLPVAVIRNFERLFGQVLQGEAGILSEADLLPAGALPTLEELTNDNLVCDEGRRALDKLVVLRLNGGLGTTMGLERAKSLLKVKEGLTFNDIIARQLEYLGTSVGTCIPLIHMTSFSTDSDVQEAMKPYGSLAVAGIPFTVLQHKHPKICIDTMMPADEEDDELNWNPPGHGDLYAALMASGLAEKLLAAGKRYMFVANADNLGATVDTAILGYLVRSGAPFLMETAKRTRADAKGGHLARLRHNNRLVLRETSQAPVGPTGEIIPEFGDIHRYDQFNTNNIWLDLDAVVRVAREHDGCIPLPLISNKKTVNPRDASSRKVIQIESAMGAAIEIFEGAVALQVPRDRFVPVKGNSDLLLVRSDVFELNTDFTIRKSPHRSIPGLPLVTLDTKYFRLLKDFEERIRAVPSLMHAESLTLKGDVCLDHHLEIRGNVTISNTSSQQMRVPQDVSLLSDQNYSG